MVEPITTAITIVKEAAEKAALAVRESLKVNEIIKEAVEMAKITEFQKMKEVYRNPTIKDITNHDFLFKSLEIAKSIPETRTSFLNRLLTDSNLLGQMGEYHVGKFLESFGNFTQHVGCVTENGKFFVDFVGELSKDMPIKLITLKDGVIKTVSELINAGESIGIEVKNGLYELKNNVGHVINQGLAAKEEAGRGFIGISQSMLETISETPDVFSKFLELVDQSEIGVILTHPTLEQQLTNIISCL